MGKIIVVYGLAKIMLLQGVTLNLHKSEDETIYFWDLLSRLLRFLRSLAMTI